jgi:Glycosyl transferase family 2
MPDAPRIVMALKVRDEEDVLEHNLRYHRAQGVDFFIVTDNASVDGTPAILERWEKAGLAQVIHEPGDDMAVRGHEWVTRMAREAVTEHGADWVVHADADEFWWPLEGSIRDALATIPAEYGVVVAPRSEFLAPPDGESPFYERQTIRETRSTLRPKVAHRGYPDVLVLHRGQHEVTIGADLEDAWQRVRPPGRAVTRTVREAGGETAEERLAWAPIFPLHILHFPLRSLAQYRRRVELLLADSSMGTPGMRERLSIALEEDRLADLYEELREDDASTESGLTSGRLARDERLRTFMAALPADPPEPSADVATPTAPGAADEDLASARNQLALDAMHVLSRTDRMLMIRNEQMRARVRTLEREARRPAETRRPGRWRGEEIRVVMAIAVRGPADALEQSLRYHRAQGVDFFIVAGSGGQTAATVGRWAAAGYARLLTEPDDDDAVTRMAQEAVTEDGADWVIHAEADEFWWPLEGSIRDALAEIPPEYGAVVAPRAEFLAAPDGDGEFFERQTVRTARSLLRPRMAHRAYADVLALGDDGQDFTVGGDLDEARRLTRPKQAPLLRGLRPRGEDKTRDRLIWSPEFPLRVFQFPLRSFEQFEVAATPILSGSGAGKGSGAKARLAKAMADGRLRETFDEVASESIERKLEKGVLVRDERLRRFLERLGDPLSGETQDVAGLWEHPSEEEVADERTQLEFDAMYLLARADRSFAIESHRAIRTIRRLRRRNAHLRRRSERLEGRVKKLRGDVKMLRNRQFRRRVGALLLRVRRRLRRLRRGKGK